MTKNIALVTGASSGVGKTIASFLSQEFDVIGIGSRTKEKIHRFSELDYSYYRCDLKDPSEIESLFERNPRFADAAVLVNCAGVMLKNEIFELDYRNFLESLKINCIAPLLMMQKVIPGMQERNFGRIINVTSGAPLNCFPGVVSYSASKSALNALTITAAKENSEWNIKINLMSPGPVRTEMAPNANLEPSECIPTLSYLLKISESLETGRFFWLGHEIPLQPDLGDIDWLNGKPSGRLRRLEGCND